MSKVIASLMAVIGVDTAPFEKGVKKVDGSLLGLAKKFATSAAVVTAFGTALKYSIDQAAESERVDAQLNAVLSSTNEIAGMTKGSLDNLAESLSKVSTFDDEAIKSTEALMLTFTNIGENVFPQATQAILDMSTAMGQDLQLSTIQIGKALNDPIKGITALTRVGVAFTDEQENMIKALVASGDTMGAQKIILAELSKEFGGSALAATKTYAGQIKMLTAELGNLAEEVGGPVINAATTYLIANRKVREVGEGNENIIKKQILAWQIYADAIFDAEQGNDSATTSYTAMAKAFASVEVAATEAIDPIKEITEINQNFLSGVQNIQSEEESYASKNKSLTEERIQLEQDRATAISQGWWTSSEKVKEYDKALEENRLKVIENKDEHERAGKVILLGLAERKFMQDGILDDKEFQWLLDKGVAWEIYSDTAIQEMKNAEAEIAILTNGINGLPTAKDIRINVITSGGATLDLFNSPVTAPVGTGRRSHATGGDFIIPMKYGNEGFQMGNGDTASGGERVSITPKGQVGQPSAPQLTERGIAKAIVGEMLKHGMGSMGR